MTHKTTSYRIAVIAGGLICLSGIAFVALYILEAIVNKLGEPDQSLLYWYLPILFLGVFGLLLGSGSVTWGVVGLRHAHHGAEVDVESKKQSMK